MENEFSKVSLTIEAPHVRIQNGLDNDILFSHFKLDVIELLNQDATVINHFGSIPDNGADGIDDLLIDGTLFRLDVSLDSLGISLDADHLAVNEAFLFIVKNMKPVYSAVLHEQGEYKNQKTIVFDFEGL